MSRSDGAYHAWKSVRYPIEPFLALHPNSTYEEIARRGGFSHSSRIHEWKMNGLTWISADKLAVAYNLHPANIWPDWFDDVLEAS